MPAVLRGVLVFSIFAAILSAPMHYYLTEIRGYDALGKWTHPILLFVLSYQVSNLAASLFMSLQSLRLQTRMFGGAFWGSVSEMWRIKRRAPYAFLDLRSKVNRRPYWLIVLSYLFLGIYSLVLHSRASSSNPLWEIAFFFGCSMIVMAPFQILIHGRRPAVLLLGVSGPESINLLRKLNLVLGTAGVASLLDPDQDQKGARDHKLSSFNLRTRDERSKEWEESVRELIGLAAAVVVDIRSSTEILEQEIQWISELDMVDKCVFLRGKGIPCIPRGGVTRSTEAGTIVGAIQRAGLPDSIRKRHVNLRIMGLV